MPEIIFEDNHLLVAIKPPGVLSQAGELPLPDMLTLLKEYLKDKYQKPGNVFLGLIHRLDLNVGGVMVFAKTSKGAARLAESIREGGFAKTYLAIAEGSFPDGDHGECEDYLVKDSRMLVAKPATPDEGKLARLTYRVLAEAELDGHPCTLLEVNLETGRFHQIRAQFALRKHPLLNDAKYNARLKYPTEAIGLWAYRISFPHPITKEVMTFKVIPNNLLFSAFAQSTMNI